MTKYFKFLFLFENINFLFKIFKCKQDLFFRIKNLN